MAEQFSNTVLLTILISVISFLVIAWLVRFLIAFDRERRYINSEILRTVGAERLYWMRQRRRLWLSLIPFVTYDQE